MICWCICWNCVTMPTGRDRESVCCRENSKYCLIEEKNERSRQSLDAAGVKSFLLISLNHSLQRLSSLRGKEKKDHSRFGRITQLKSAQNAIFAVLKFNSPRSYSSPRGSSPNYATISLSDKFSQVALIVPFVSRRKKDAFKVRYLSDFWTKSFKTSYYDYSHHRLSF